MTTDHARQLRRWLDNEETQSDLTRVLRTLPEEIEPGLVVEVMLWLFAHESVRLLGRGVRLPEAVIRAFIAVERPDPRLLFLRLFLTEEPTPARWARGIQALLDLDLTYAWGSKLRRDRFAKLAADAEILRAMQGAVAHSQAVSRSMLAVLVADGSDASYDALVPHLDAALVGKDRRLERLTALRTHAKRTPALDALFAEVGATLDERNASSPALALGPLIGIGHVEPLYFTAWIYAGGGGQANVRVDSRRSSWLQVTATNGEVHLQCDDLVATPAWLAARQVEWGLRWERVALTRASLRGTKREAVGRWLLSLSATTGR